MNKLKQVILEQGKLIDDDILKVDRFLNHQIDCSLVKEMGEAFWQHFKEKPITKIVTIETSGIAPSIFCGLLFNVPVIFIKKTQPSTMQDPVFSEVFSFTKQKTYTVCLEKEFLTEDDHVLFIDDFLANGEAFHGAEKLIEQCGATIEGVGIVIEKAFQAGHQYIIDQGYDLYALASIASMKEGTIVWAE